MEKLSLNNEIVLCRAMVKKARVRIIRKLIGKLKILRSCKKVENKEKRGKKADRLLEEILTLKKLKVDDVTKFALKNTDVTDILRKTPSNHQDHAYATLAVFPELQKRVESIRERIPDWETQLPKLLQELGTRSMLKKWKRINQGLPEKLVARKKEKEEKLVEENDEEKAVKKVDKKPKKALNIAVEKEAETKVDDPFFVSKKVAVPKLLLTEIKDNPEKEIKFSRDEPERRQFSKLIPIKKVDAIVEEELHPSWAAKKVKLIQPFQGKKIKFDD